MNLIHHRLQAFAESVKAKTGAPVQGQPEEQLRAPFENFVASEATAWNWEVVCVGEAILPDHLGRPDYAVERNRLLAGYVELKAPGVGANAARFRGRDRAQFKRFSGIPNLLYTDGNEWALYRSGERVGAIVRLSGEIAVDGQDAVSPEDARAVDLGRREMFGMLHGNWHSPAVCPVPPLCLLLLSGSSCVGNTPPFRLILCWTILIPGRRAGASRRARPACGAGRAPRAEPGCTRAATPPRRASPPAAYPRGASPGAAPRSRRCRRTRRRSRGGRGRRPRWLVSSSIATPACAALKVASLGTSHFSATASTETMRTRRGQRRWRSETPWTSARMRCTSFR